MSCIHFGAESLGNIVKVLAKSSLEEQGEVRFRYSVLLARISTANTKAFNHRYPDQHAEPATSVAILEASHAPNKVGNLIEACRTAGLIHYNCDEGKDWLALTKGGMAALSEVLNALLFVQADALEHANKLVEAYSPGP